MGYIYKIQNKINGKSYIGQTRKHYEQRWYEHIKTAFSNAPSSQESRYSIHFALRKYGIENFDFSIVEEVDDELLDDREQYWIRVEDSFYNGYNETLGGSQGLQYDYDVIFKQYMSNHNIMQTAEECHCGRDTVRAAVLAHGINPIDIYRQDVHSPYDYKEIAESYQQLQNVRKVCDIYGCDTRVVYNACHYYDIPMLSSGECTQKELGKPVCQIDLETLQVIAKYPSATNAALKVLNDKGKSRNILACCYHRQKTAYGYGWIFEGEAIPEDIKQNNKYRKIRQIDKETGEVIAHFKSGMDAARSLGKGESAAGVILRTCRHIIKTAYGYIWEYED